MAPKQASLIESARYTREKQAIQPDARRFEEVEAGFSGHVSARPEGFPGVEGTLLRVIKTRAGLGGCPALRVFFSTDTPDQFTLQSVEISEDQSQASTSIFRD